MRRILFSTLLSCIVYYHPSTEMGLVGIIVVFVVIAYRIQQQSADKSLFVWKDKTVGYASRAIKYIIFYIVISKVI